MSSPLSSTLGPPQNHQRNDRRRAARILRARRRIAGPYNLIHTVGARWRPPERIYPSSQTISQEEPCEEASPAQDPVPGERRH